MGRLKGISPIISPDLLHALSSMGHGDTIVLADANFPVSSTCLVNGAKEIRADGHGIPELLEAILKLLPLDSYVYAPAMFMELVNRDKNMGMEEPPVWSEYRKILEAAEERLSPEPGNSLATPRRLEVLGALHG